MPGRIKATFLTAAAALSSLAFAASAQAIPARSGPGAAQIVQQFTIVVNGRQGVYTLREGNSNFGRAHIAKGGSSGNKDNHELTQYAKDRWVEALREGVKANTYPGGYRYTKHYSTPGGTKRTMCLGVDGNDYFYANENYGTKGIITAFWVDGHVGQEKCNRD